jgi:hypothetical protein
MRYTRNEVRSIKAYMGQGFTHGEAVKMKIFDILHNKLFCDMDEDERYSDENLPLIEKYENLIVELGI